MEVTVFQISPPEFLFIPISVSLFLVSSPCLCLSLSCGAVSICLFLLFPFLLTYSKRVYCHLTNMHTIYQDNADSKQMRKEKKNKRKMQNRVRNETNTKMHTMDLYSQAMGAINFLYTLQQSFQRWKYNSMSIR